MTIISVVLYYDLQGRTPYAMNKFVLDIESAPTAKGSEVPLRAAQDLIHFLDKFIRDGEGAASIGRNDNDFLLLGTEGSYPFVRYDPQSRKGDCLWLATGRK